LERTSSLMSRTPDRVLFGASYYHEYQPSPRLEADLDLMVEAGFSAIRVGESVWSTWEPEDGRFNLEWLAPVLDGAHQRGIQVILGTPTYAVPPWLARRYPEIAAETETGKRHPWGARQEIDYSHAAFKFHAERIIRKIVTRYVEHLAVIGFQVDNEPGAMMFHNHGVFQRFVDELRHTYGTVEALNEAWGLVYWSHKLSTWADLWTPDGNAQPQYDLAWRRFQARLTTEFIAWQADIVREYLRDDQFVMTDLAFDRPTVEEAVITQSLDVAVGNPYYLMQDAFGVPDQGSAGASGWMTSGVWSLYFTADRIRAAKQAPFMITETNAGSIGGPASNFPAYDGQWRQAAWAFVARGAQMVQYWHWHTNHFGTETYWVGILPHDQQPGRVFHELSRLGEEFRVAGNRVIELDPDAQVGLLYSTHSKWALIDQAPLSKPGMTGGWVGENMDPQSYHRIFQAFYRGTFDAGVAARIVHDVQLVTSNGERLRDPAEVVAELPTLIVAGLLVADDALLGWLRDYAALGGHLVLGPRTAYGDSEGRARTDVKPALLAEAAGVHYQEFSNLVTPLAVIPSASTLELAEGSLATAWVDQLIADGAITLASYDHPHFGQYPAVVTRRHEQGRITTVGTVPDPAMAASLMRWAAPATESQRWTDLPISVTVSSATNSNGERIHVVHNWSWTPQQIALHQPMEDVLARDGQPVEVLDLGAWDVRVLAE
jgi:beta-galactosidase